MDSEDIMDKDVRETIQAPTDIDYLIENKECTACVSYEMRTFEYPCNGCDRSKNFFEEDCRDNIIDRVTEEKHCG